jgi:hypothetical protein
VSPAISPNPIRYYIDGQLANMSIPSSWEAEGISKPSTQCLERVREFLYHLGDTFGILPYKVAYTKDQAVYAAYRNSTNHNVLRIEIDEDLDIIANVSDGERILASASLDTDSEEMRLISAFDPRLARAA